MPVNSAGIKASSGGYIKIHRKLFSNDLFTEHPEYIGPWVWMLCTARWQTNGIGRGQLKLSLRLLANKFFNGSVKKARIFRARLEAHKAIEWGTQKGTQASLVTICNYDAYQGLSDEQGTLGGTVTPEIGHTKGHKKEEGFKKVEEKKGRKVEARATRLPQNWLLPDDYLAWAIENQKWPPEYVQQVAEKFKDYWIGVGGAKARKVDWLATWRNWCRETKPPTTAKTPSKTTNRIAARIAREREQNGQR